MTEELSPDFLLLGAFCALEQAWELLRDSVTLFEKGRYANSLVLSVYCLEEVGRKEISLRFRKEALGSSPVKLETLKKACDNHVQKLAQGQVHVPALFVAEVPPPGRAEETLLFKRLTEKRLLLEKHGPQQAHVEKFRALYVDPSIDGSGWNRPSEVTRAEAEGWLGVAALSYDRHRGSLVYPEKGTELAAAIANLSVRPNLPEPSWDPWNWSECNAE